MYGSVMPLSPLGQYPILEWESEVTEEYNARCYVDLTGCWKR